MFSKIQYNSPVILSFALLSIFVLFLAYLTNGASNVLVFSVYPSSFTDPLAYIRIFTHVLGHANFDHYVSNFMIILLVGPMLEEKYGSVTILIMIILTAFITGIFNLIFFPTTAILGASGVCFMFILLSSYANFKKGKIPLTLIVVIVMYLGKEVYNYLYVPDDISQFAHIIGGIFGAVIGYFINRHQVVKNEKIIIKNSILEEEQKAKLLIKSAEKTITNNNIVNNVTVDDDFDEE